MDNELLGPVLISRSDSGLDAYDKRDVFIGNRKSSDKDSSGYLVFVLKMEIREAWDFWGINFECLMIVSSF